jgi:hypothetical protein
MAMRLPIQPVWVIEHPEFSCRAVFLGEVAAEIDHILTAWVTPWLPG